MVVVVAQLKRMEEGGLFFSLSVSSPFPLFPEGVCADYSKHTRTCTHGLDRGEEEEKEAGFL